MLTRVTTYLSFLEHARCPVRGFHNFLSYQRDWLDADRHRRLPGPGGSRAGRSARQQLARRLPRVGPRVDRTVLPALAELRSLRAQAYVILAWGHLRRADVQRHRTTRTVAWSAAQRLVECYQRSERPDWQWFESRLTYANAVLPHALFVAGQRWPEEEFLEVAEASFDFLDRVTTADDVFWPIGNSDWYPHGEEKALYDQQPVEAVTMADAALAAFGLRRRRKVPGHLLPGARLVSRPEQFGRTAGRRRSRRLLRRPAAARRESQPRSGIDARLFVDGRSQPGNSSRGGGRLTQSAVADARFHGKLLTPIERTRC